MGTLLDVPSPQNAVPEWLSLSDMRTGSVYMSKMLARGAKLLPWLCGGGSEVIGVETNMNLSADDSQKYLRAQKRI
jgi:hypothetical protein